MRDEIVNIKDTDYYGWEYLTNVCKWISCRENKYSYDWIPFASNITCNQHIHKDSIFIPATGIFSSDNLYPKIVLIRTGSKDGWHYHKNIDTLSISPKHISYSELGLWCTPWFYGWCHLIPLYFDNKKLSYPIGYINKIYNSYPIPTSDQLFDGNTHNSITLHSKNMYIQYTLLSFEDIKEISSIS